MKKTVQDKIFDGPDHIDWAGVPWTDIEYEDYHVATFRDKYPCTPGHLLFVPKYNTIGVLKDAFEDAVRYGKKMVETGTWDGFNVGLNYGSCAGQTINWPHIHLIPRRAGDVEDPIGGVRNTIPGKGNYRSPSYKQD
jgi:diadenosine tetraphosphate (Ap4A) HIT family hydrolase